MSDELQEEQIVMGAKAEEIVQCQQCGKEIKVKDGHSFETEDGREVYVCSECIAQINQALENETKNPNIFGAVLFGILAAAICAAIWYWIASNTGTEYGIIAIAAGWFIGSAVRKGSGNKKGTTLQLIAGIITFLAIVFAELFIGIQFIAQDPEVNMSVGQLFTSLILSGDIFSLLWLVIKAAGPIGLLIWGFGIYWAYMVPRPTKI